MTKWEDQLTSNELSPLSLEARDEDYDTYLFWPSLGNWMDSKSFVATHQSHMSPLLDHPDYYPGWDTTPLSPPSLVPPDFRFPPPREDQTPGGALPGARGGGVQKQDLFPRYSNIFRMGLLMRAARFVDRAVQAVRATLCKAKPRGQALKRAHAFDS